MNSSPPPPPPTAINKPLFSSNGLGRTTIQRSVHEEVAEACRRRGLSSFQIRATKLRLVNPIMQSGPTCGPVALAMLLDADASQIVEMAKQLRFTSNGEMFSCADMAELAGRAGQKLGQSIKIRRCSGNLHSMEIQQMLIDGATLLVPYDADFNHAPCLRRGHRAHWAAIVGVIISDNLNKTLILARHGKSAHLAAWSLEELAASNGNLTEFPPHRMTDGLDYVVPPGGIAGHRGLCSQFIVIEMLPKRQTFDPEAEQSEKKPLLSN